MILRVRDWHGKHWLVLRCLQSVQNLLAAFNFTFTFSVFFFSFHPVAGLISLKSTIFDHFWLTWRASHTSVRKMQNISDCLIFPKGLHLKSPFWCCLKKLEQCGRLNFNLETTTLCMRERWRSFVWSSRARRVASWPLWQRPPRSPLTREVTSSRW